MLEGQTLCNPLWLPLTTTLTIDKVEKLHTLCMECSLISPLGFYVTCSNFTHSGTYLLLCSDLIGNARGLDKALLLRKTHTGSVHAKLKQTSVWIAMYVGH